MNESFNPFRSVSREEVESDHAFRTLRRFPAISKSLPNARESVSQLKGSTTITKFGTKTSRKRQLKSTHRLEELCKSSLTESGTLSQFRKQIINDREKPPNPFAEYLPKRVPPVNDPLKTGNAKLTKFAIRYDSRRMNNDLEGFHGLVLDKDAFDYQLKRCLSIYLTKDELDALFVYIDTDKGGTIDGVEFLRYFFKLGQDAKEDLRMKMLATAAEMEKEKARKLALEKKQIIEANNKLNVEYTEEHAQSATEKLNRAAFLFQGNSTSVEFRDVGSKLAPVEFKLFLEKTFNFRLSTPEVRSKLLWAVIVLHYPAVNVGC